MKYARFTKSLSYSLLYIGLLAKKLNSSTIRVPVLGSLIIGACLTGFQMPPARNESTGKERIVQAHAVLTVAEGKRLIAKGVAMMPIVEKALRDGAVIVCRGTTNTYVAEELLERKIPHGGFVTGRVTPQKGAAEMPEVNPMTEIVLVKGQYRPDLTLDDALKQLVPGDVIIKGGNALDYTNKTVGVWNSSPTGGTCGKILPYIHSGTAQLVIPIGLEKQVSGKVEDIALKVNQSELSVTKLPRMQILTGHIVTEIEALRILANVEAFQASAGGIAGAEGAAWLVWRGNHEDVEKARAMVASVQGEQPFIR